MHKFKVKKAILILTAALGLGTAATQAQTIGSSTRAEVDRVFGKPFSDEGGMTCYIYKSRFIGVAFDANGICQGVVVYNVKNRHFSKEECDSFDRLFLPAGSYEWATFPVDQMAQVPGCTVDGMYWALVGSDLLIVMDAEYQFQASAFSAFIARGYATRVGAELIGKWNLGQEMTHFPTKGTRL